jgi:hypothetical protein
MNTLLDCKNNSTMVSVANVGSGTPAFVGYVNEAVRELMSTGDWWNTVVKAMLNAYDGCITWPRWVGSLRALTVRGGSARTYNRWYTFVPIDRAEWGWLRDWRSGSWRGEIVVENDGTTPVFNNIPCGSTNYIQVYRRLAVDNGKTITFFGLDANGQPYSETLTLANGAPGTPYQRTANAFQRIDQVSKDVTAGIVDVFQYDPINNVLLDCAHYAGGETSPDYQHSRIRGGLSGCCNGARTLTLLAKQQFVPVVSNTDIVQIDNLEAISTMIQSLKCRVASDPDGAVKFKLLAIKNLNNQLRDHYPNDQIPVQINPFGTALPAQHGIGRMQ